jgi:L-erythro-3,5-diaminohexanoate dehydrogenase
VFIIGAGGKSGLLCLHEARKRAGVSGRVIGMSRSDAGVARIRETGLANVALQGDATRPVEVLRMVEEASAGELADVVINTVNISDTEMASVLSCREGGLIYFFSMATSFTKAALGAEGIGRDVQMLIGNGYCSHHAEIALEVLRENAVLRGMFTRMYS